MLYIFPLIIIAGLLRHIVHECGHMLTAIILGEKIVKVQWFTYHGGTNSLFCSCFRKFKIGSERC